MACRIHQVICLIIWMVHMCVVVLDGWVGGWETETMGFIVVNIFSHGGEWTDLA